MVSPCNTSQYPKESTGNLKRFRSKCRKRQGRSRHTLSYSPNTNFRSLALVTPITNSLFKISILVTIHFVFIYSSSIDFPGGSVVKNPPAKQETQVLSLGWENSLEKEMTIHSSILAWRIPWSEEHGGLQSMGSQVTQTLFSDWASFFHVRNWGTENKMGEHMTIPSFSSII